MLRADRDRYVAFSFAGSDVLIEVDLTGNIIKAHGAQHTVFGDAAGALAQQKLDRLFCPSDQALIRILLQNLKFVERIDQAMVGVPGPSGRPQPVLFGACRVDTWPDRYFVTLTQIQPDLTGAAYAARDAETGLLPRDAFLAAVQKASDRTGEDEQRHLTLMKIKGVGDVTRSLPTQKAQELLQGIGAALRAGAEGGSLAGRLEEETFGLVQAGRPNPEGVRKAVQGVLQKLEGSARGLSVEHSSLDLAARGLTREDVGKALGFAIRNYLEKGDGFDFGASLQTHLTAAVSRAADDIASLRRTLDRQALKLEFQPIVDPLSGSLHHYEALLRLPDGTPPFELVSFSEKVGMAVDLDLTVLELAMGHLALRPDVTVAVNLSGQSVQDETFRERLLARLARDPGVASRLIFELTESNLIESVGDAAPLLQALRKGKYKICLDDFGAGATAYNYLRSFEVDFVKIDGLFLQAAQQSQRYRALLSSVCRVCAELRCGTIGEMIETEAQRRLAIDLGIELCQGWLFGRPGPFLPKRPPAERSA